MIVRLACAVLLSLTALGLSTAAAPAQGLKQTPGSQLSIAQCDPHQHPVGSPAHPWIDPYGVYHGMQNFPYWEGFLAITYTNEASVAAKEIDFGLVSRGSLIALAKDVGTFSPGVAIEHEFSLDPQVFPIGTQFPYCAVLRIVYADGREWRNPNPPSE